MEKLKSLVLVPVVLVLRLISFVKYFFTDDMTDEQIKYLTRDAAMNRQERMLNK